MSWTSEHILHPTATLRTIRTHMMSMASQLRSDTICVLRGVSASSLFAGKAPNSKHRLRHTGVRCMDPSSMVARCTKTYDDFPIIFPLEKAVLLLEYKTQVQENDRVGAPCCSTSALCGQILKSGIPLWGESSQLLK